MIRRHFLQLAAAGAMLPAASQIGSTQRPKLAQLLRADLRGQNQSVQETVVNLLEMAGCGTYQPERRAAIHDPHLCNLSLIHNDTPGCLRARLAPKQGLKRVALALGRSTLRYVP
jgi:hypothetical protein